jgi:hypothetical protein
LFYRERHHSPFIYQGKLILEGYLRLSEKPSRFVLRRSTP